jgi:hypothetical protein
VNLVVGSRRCCARTATVCFRAPACGKMLGSTHSTTPFCAYAAKQLNSFALIPPAPRKAACLCLHKDAHGRACTRSSAVHHKTAALAHVGALICAYVLPCPWFAVLTVAACRVFEREGVQVVCDTVSMDFLKGAVIEFEDSLMRSAFQVSRSACDCVCVTTISCQLCMCYHHIMVLQVLPAFAEHSRQQQPHPT